MHTVAGAGLATAAASYWLLIHGQASELDMTDYYLCMALLALNPGLCEGLSLIILTVLNIPILVCNHLKDFRNCPVQVTRSRGQAMLLRGIRLDCYRLLTNTHMVDTKGYTFIHVLIRVIFLVMCSISCMLDSHRLCACRRSAL